MQIVNGQVLDQLTQHADKLIGASDVDDSLDDLAVINLLIIRIIPWNGYTWKTPVYITAPDGKW